MSDLSCEYSSAGVGCWICLWVWRLWRPSSPAFIPKAESARADCSRLSLQLCLNASMMVTSQHLWAACSSGQPPSQQEILVCLTGISCIFLHARCILVCRCVSLKRVCFHLNSHPPQSGIYTKSLNRTKSFSWHLKLSIQTFAPGPGSTR